MNLTEFVYSILRENVIDFIDADVLLVGYKRIY